MAKKAKVLIEFLIEWVKQNIWKLAIIAAVHIGVTRLLDLPYINLIRTIISYSAFLVDFILILILFKPDKKYLLYIGIGLFPFAALVEVVHSEKIVEIAGNISYLFILSYILLSLKEIRQAMKKEK